MPSDTSRGFFLKSAVNVFASAVSACRNQIRWCCDYYQQKGWYHQSAHRQSFGKGSHKLKVSVNVFDADWQKIQELLAKERQWMAAQMQMEIREVNSMFADVRKKSPWAIQGIWWLLSRSLCLVVLLVILRPGILRVHLSHSHDSWQITQQVLII